MIKVKENTTIYVLCPAYTKTGGTELLHQLVHELNNQNKKSFITYFNYDESNSKYTDEAYKKYVNNYKLISEIIDSKNNIIVFPEVFCDNVEHYKKCKKVMWWLSVDNYLEHYGVLESIKIIGFVNFLRKLKNEKVSFSNKKIYKMDYHLCQSYYAIDFLNKKGITNTGYLSDYINDIYLEQKKVDISFKENIVLYNPKKGIKFTKKIMEYCPNFNWIPIQNMTNDEVRNLLLKSKVYIDFGNHPGKDRFPREAASCGCCVITGKRGSAKFYKDVPIEDEFKFKDKKNNIPKIAECIEKCLNEYENQIKKFKEYKKFIMGEKKQFAIDVKNTFNN